MRDITVAAVCMHSEPGRVEENLAHMELFASEAVSRGAEMICFPELCISGYVLNEPHSLYGPGDSQNIMARIVDMAATHEVVIMAGMVEILSRGKPYISHIVSGPKGMLGVYRKTHLSPIEKGVFQAGAEIGIFRYKNVAFGIQLCYEAHFPEISTLMALKEAEIIFMPHASPRGTPQEKLDSWLRHLRSRAFDNALYVVACNQVGQTSEGYQFPGVAVVVDPSGLIISQRMRVDEGMVVATLKANRLEEIRTHQMRYFLPNRRPELYRALIGG
ncbi:MAG: nitrilase [Deltaproteobacteria bacterium]|nr:MAG: nitrilase [Deltaproteobacteria bacterium]